jgi:hypothetical protein
MIDQKPIVRQAAWCIAGLLLTWMLPWAATAQTQTCTATSQPGQNPTPVDDLACSIRQQFGAVYGNGVLGNDWCFNVETERGYNWWYYNLAPALPSGTPDPNGLTATLVTNTARIQATYIPPNSNARQYASVFLGIDGSTQHLPVSVALSQSTTVKAAEAASAKAPEAGPKLQAAMSKGLVSKLDPKLLHVPGAPESNCQSLGDFLIAYALPYNLEVTAVSRTPDLGSGMGYLNSRYWMFNGRGHSVLNVGTYLITLVDPSQSNKPYNVNLVVGFGGGAGP